MRQDNRSASFVCLSRPVVCLNGAHALCLDTLAARGCFYGLFASFRLCWSCSPGFARHSALKRDTRLRALRLPDFSNLFSSHELCRKPEVALALLPQTAVDRLLRPGTEVARRPRQRYWDVAAFAAVAVGSVVLLGFADWPRPDRTLEFSGLTVAAILVSALARPQSTTKDWASMPPSFVVDFASLLLLGAHATLLVVVAGMVAHRLTDPHPTPPRRMVLNATTAMIATLVAGIAHQALGGTTGQLAWPWHGVPIAAAVVAYCFMTSASAG
jgi:hypothetical protein